MERIRRKSNYNLKDSTIVKICISYASDFGFVIYCLKTKNMIDVCHEIHTLKNRLGKKNQVHYPLLQKHLQQL